MGIITLESSRSVGYSGMPVTLSLAMIVKNEDQVLGRILAQARQVCDELIVVDTGYTDNTVAVAQSFGAQVHSFEWIDDFSAARNFAFAQCTGDWILWLDADDVLPETAVQKILQLKATELGDHWDAVICNYNIAFDPEGRCTVSMPRERLLRRDCGGAWQFPIHEGYVLPEGANCLDRLDIAIEHDKPEVYVERSSHRNLDMLAKLIEQGDQSPRTWYYYGKELRYHDRLEEAVQAFAEHVELNSTEKVSRYQALHMGMTCLMELERYAEAKDWGFQAIQTDSSRAEALTELGVIDYRQGCCAEAIPFLMGATACLHPGYGSVLEENYSWRPYHYLSLCYEGLGDYQKAIEMAMKAYPTIPDKEAIRYNIECFAGKLR